MRRTVTTWIAMGLVLVAAAGCSDDSPTAKERYCAQRSTVAGTIDTIIADVGKADFGAAKEALGSLPGQVDQLSKDADALSSEVKDALAPKLDSLQASVAAVQQVTSLTELGPALDAVKTDLQAALEELGSSASC